MYRYYRDGVIYTYKKFGFGSIDFPTILYSYPSYLGIDILTASDKDMPPSLLGFTNGRSIVIKNGIKDVENFVLLHEEEHVKDMSASEIEVDKRALKRLISKKVDEKKIANVLRLLEKRWDIKIPNPEDFVTKEANRP